MITLTKITTTNNQTNVKKTNKPEKNTLSVPVKVAMGSGLVCLASAGIYVLSRSRGEDITKIVEKLNKSPSLMNILKDVKLSSAKFKHLMFRITEDDKLSQKFIKEMISNPPKSKEYVRILNRKIGGDKHLLDWMHGHNGYQQAYGKYIKNTYESANHPDDLIKLSPNWNIWKLKEKFGDDFTFGELPKEFGGTDGYRDKFYKSFGNNNQGEVNYGEYIIGGMSGKGVRKVTAGGKNYILKYQSLNENIKDDISMKSDSAFLNAQLDRFLQLNGYEQGSKLKFFDYKTNSALYECTNGEIPKNISGILEVNRQLGKLNALGIYYNDVSQSNFLVESEKLRFIDSGESSFVDFFKPGVTGYHFSLPNLNGHSLSDTAAAITLSKN